MISLTSRNDLLLTVLLFFLSLSVPANRCYYLPGCSCKQAITYSFTLPQWNNYYRFSLCYSSPYLLTISLFYSFTNFAYRSSMMLILSCNLYWFLSLSSVSLNLSISSNVICDSGTYTIMPVILNIFLFIFSRGIHSDCSHHPRIYLILSLSSSSHSPLSLLKCCLPFTICWKHPVHVPLSCDEYVLT